ncbi:alpha,alpha-phosphotrehalase [Corynebacterium sp. 13CS0277]|uniref:alpha,alpha-phosphotrehalase n=1 Tax=Corynebacterium sp. 13CS0277 TaxID=2071994 RepID=UPI001E49047B|nr:alpha,alpha-phosphotrehalase [Corynebacterium sp. 13CS0277]
MTPQRSFADKVIYQIYPKSFYDSNGDGVGDLRGIIAKIPYLSTLGIDMIWFNPFFPSPGNDNGYDVADYCAIDPAMGTMEDFEELIAGLKEHNIGVMLDMVLNHVSTEHEWFQKALAGDEKYQDYFIIRDKEDTTNWVSKFGGSAWAPFGDTGKYYLHLYDVTQADLNWHNPAVREEAAKVINFWRDKGVYGFRFDVINVIGKDKVLVSAPEGVDDRTMYTDGPLVDQWLQELAARSFGQDERHVTVGEMSSTSIERCIGYTNPNNRELDMSFNFHHLKVDYVDGEKWSNGEFEPAKLIAMLHTWGEGMQEGDGWNAWFFNNHDQPRALDRFGDVENYRRESATLLAAAVHLNRGTPFTYMGEEIGMSDPEYTSIDDYVDVEAKNAYAALVEAGHAADEAFAIVHSKARDNARTPMQWDASATAGFTTGTPWLRPTNQATVNVEAALAEADAHTAGEPMPVLSFYRRLHELRHTTPVIAHGSYVAYLADHEAVYAFIREYEGTRMLVACNFTATPQTIPLPEEFLGAAELINNAAPVPAAAEVTLSPYQAVAYLLEG